MIDDRDDRRKSTPNTEDSWEVVFEEDDEAPRKRRLSDQERSVLARLLHEPAAAH
jgi:hypothetical protein